MKKIFFLVNKKYEFSSENYLEKHLKNFEINKPYIGFIILISIINFSFFKQEKIHEAHSIFLFENETAFFELLDRG